MGSPRPWYDRKLIETSVRDLAVALERLDKADSGVTERDRETLHRLTALASRAATDAHYFEHDGYVTQFVTDMKAGWKALHRLGTSRHGELALQISTANLAADADVVDAIVRNLAVHVRRRTLAEARAGRAGRSTPLSKALADALVRLLAEEDYARAAEALETCSDSERVRTAVLILAAKEQDRAEELEELALAALRDWRDVLMWAEYSPESIDYGAELTRLGLPPPSPS
jgi:hypothetical protein